MKTDTIAAWQVEKGDLITLGSDATFEVSEKHDSGDGISLMLKDDEGDLAVFHFTPDDPIELVVSLDDPEDQLLDFSHDQDAEVPSL